MAFNEDEAFGHVLDGLMVIDVPHIDAGIQKNIAA